jgi:cytochrome c2
MRASAVAAPLAVALVAVAAGCGRGTSHPTVTGGNASRGKQLIEYYGCGSCHVIGGIATANGTVGPSLVGLPNGQSIAGKLPNTPAALERWIQHPQEIVPGTIMPDLGVNPAQAKDIASYLYGHQ